MWIDSYLYSSTLGPMSLLAGSYIGLCSKGQELSILVITENMPIPFLL